MASSAIRRKGGQGADASAGARAKAEPKGIPPMFRGFVSSSKDAAVSLSAAALKRVRVAWEEGGEARGLLQEQTEWVRQWIATGELAPRDAATAFRGLSKVLEQIEGRTEGAPAPVTVVMGDAPAEPTTGDPLQVH